MIACVRLPDLSTADRRLDAAAAALAELTPQVEVEGSLSLRADARPRRQPYTVPRGQVDEDLSITLYADLGRLRLADGLDAAARIHQLLQRGADLTPAVGLAGGRFPARVVALSLEPVEMAVLARGREADFLAPYPVDLLPVDGETLRQLGLLGLRTLGDIAALPGPALADRFGAAGRTMHRLAGGRDTSRIASYMPRQTETDSLGFEPAVVDRGSLEKAIRQLASRLAARLEGAGLAAGRIGLALTLADGRQVEREIALRQPTHEALHLTRTAHDLLPGSLPAGVAEVCLRLDDAIPLTVRQLSLFERDPVQRQRLREVLKALVARYGDECFYWAALVDPEPGWTEPRFRWHKVEDEG
jgi:nucleotidyltransferase/DNA polymerase involved in DNA repair